MKSFKDYLGHEATKSKDAEEVSRQKEHLKNKSSEYQDQADKEKMLGGGGGAAEAKGKSFDAASDNIKKEEFELNEAKSSAAIRFQKALQKEKEKSERNERLSKPYVDKVMGKKNDEKSVKEEVEIEEELKKEFQTIADKIIDDCVVKATSSLHGSIQQYYDNVSLGQTVKVILEKK